VNAGRENTKSTDVEVTVTLKLLDCSLAIDQALADQYRFGAEAYVAREAVRHLKSGFSHLEQTMFGGTGFDAAGFSGLGDNAGLNGLADEMVHDGGGVAAAAQTSVWAIRTGNDLRDMVAISGMDGEIRIGDIISQFIDVTGGRMPVYAVPVFMWQGMQIGGARSVGRLGNIDATATLDDDKIAEVLSLFPANRGPNILAMTRTSLKQLRQSRTATNPTGSPADFPTESFGVQIITTDSLTATEAVLV
jgi:hypothetical protein